MNHLNVFTQIFSFLTLLDADESQPAFGRAEDDPPAWAYVVVLSGLFAVMIGMLSLGYWLLG